MKQPISTYNTGKDHLSNVAQTVLWEEQSVLFGYPEPYTVSGTNEVGQYEPFTQDVCTVVLLACSSLLLPVVRRATEYSVTPFLAVIASKV